MRRSAALITRLRGKTSEIGKLRPAAQREGSVIFQKNGAFLFQFHRRTVIRLAVKHGLGNLRVTVTQHNSEDPLHCLIQNCLVERAGLYSLHFLVYTSRCV